MNFGKAILNFGKAILNFGKAILNFVKYISGFVDFFDSSEVCNGYSGLGSCLSEYCDRPLLDHDWFRLCLFVV